LTFAYIVVSVTILVFAWLEPIFSIDCIVNHWCNHLCNIIPSKRSTVTVEADSRVPLLHPFVHLLSDFIKHYWGCCLIYLTFQSGSQATRRETVSLTLAGSLPHSGNMGVISDVPKHSWLFSSCTHGRIILLGLYVVLSGCAECPDQLDSCESEEAHFWDRTINSYTALSPFCLVDQQFPRE
jgi:hypothetical protein